jgi:spermidine synthase
MKPIGKHIIAELIYCSKKKLNNKAAIEKILVDGIKECGLSLVSIHGQQFSPAGVTCVAIISESHIAIHTYPEARHASVDIFTCSADQKKPFALLEYIKRELKPKTVRVADVCRGNPLEVRHADWITGFSAVGFEVRYHIKNSLMSKRSKYQQIDVIENDNFGRILLLDKDLQIAESDAYMYNQNLVSPIVRANIPLNKILILGGGDGGVADELLHHDAKSIILVEIDKEVIDASKKYLKKICKNAYKSPRVKVIIDDAYKYMGKNKGFDAVIYDLTMHPEAFIKIDREVYLSRLFKKIKDSLNSGGMVTLQCGPEVDHQTYKMVTRMLSKHFTDVKFVKSFIPSYCVDWYFASAKKV